VCALLSSLPTYFLFNAISVGTELLLPPQNSWIHQSGVGNKIIIEKLVINDDKLLDKIVVLLKQWLSLK